VTSTSTAKRGGAKPEPTKPADDKDTTGWPLFEVFIRARRGLSHNHVGSLHAPDAEMALRNARDTYTRRQEGVSIWVVPSTKIIASSPEEKDSFFDPTADKIYRHPTFYDVPSGVQM
jgi:ring-1,2-phenylacetyl-CoA epoxidase subunit PaaB